MKKMIVIRRWDNEEVIIEGEYGSVKECLEKNKDKVSFFRAGLGGVDLREVDLSGVDLVGTEFDWANLKNTIKT